ncbi:MAG: amino acid--tRNA ligase-related protein, partial [Patescibacteria group bacterium]
MENCLELMAMRVLTRDIIKFENKEIELRGWVDVRRDHGKLIFIDLRDRTGIAQVVFADKSLHKEADKLRSEWVVKITGQVQKRPKGMENLKIPGGDFEISATNLEVLAEAQTPPFDLSGDGMEVGEEARMHFRYVDLRRGRLQKNLRNRAKAMRLIREFLSARDFCEIETPILGKSTPEGARDYLVPSRVWTAGGDPFFYALP